MFKPGTRVHLRHEFDPMWCAVATIPGIEYQEVYGTVRKSVDYGEINLVEWDAGDANPWPDEALEVVDEGE
jgi:hypothetical protein